MCCGKCFYRDEGESTKPLCLCGVQNVGQQLTTFNSNNARTRFPAAAALEARMIDQKTAMDNVKSAAIALAGALPTSRLDFAL